jgi:hypothetical protein
LESYHDRYLVAYALLPIQEEVKELARRRTDLIAHCCGIPQPHVSNYSNCEARSTPSEPISMTSTSAISLSTHRRSLYICVPCMQVFRIFRVPIGKEAAKASNQPVIRPLANRLYTCTKKRQVLNMRRLPLLGIRFHRWNAL